MVFADVDPLEEGEVHEVDGLYRLDVVLPPCQEGQAREGNACDFLQDGGPLVLT